MSPESHLPAADPMTEPTILDASDLSLPPGKDDAWRREQRAFPAPLPSLLPTHRDQYVAVHGGRSSLADQTR